MLNEEVFRDNDREYHESVKTARGVLYGLLLAAPFWLMISFGIAIHLGIVK